MRPRAVFLDRDGTLNHERDFLGRVSDLRLFPGAARAVRRLNDAGFKVVLITNQSGVARGYFTEATVAEINRELTRRLWRNAGAVIDAIYACFHHPQAEVAAYRVRCDCRKPLPGLILRAAAEMNLDLSRSFAVGDRLRDLEAGARAGVPGVLVRTGYGRGEELKLSAQGDIIAACVCDDLATAVDWVLGQGR